jgi:Tetratricopeptide repeat
MLLGCRIDPKVIPFYLWSIGVYFRRGFHSRLNQIGFAASSVITAPVLLAVSEAGAPVWAIPLVGSLMLIWLVVFYVGFGGWVIARSADKHVAAGRLDQAIAAHSSLVAFQPMNHMTLAWRGRCLLLACRYDEAAEDFRAAIRLNPNFPRHHLELAQCYAMRGSVRDAIEILDRAVATEPRCAWNWQTRGALLLSIGGSEEALSSFDRVMELGGDAIDEACFMDLAGAFDSSQSARISIRILIGQSQTALRQLEQWQSDRYIEVDKVLLRGMATGSWPPAELPDLPPEIDRSNIDHVLLAVLHGVEPLETAELDRAKDGTIESCISICAFHCLLGEISLMMGREDQAIARFNRAMLDGTPIAISYGLARARLVQLGRLSARGPWLCADGSRCAQTAS